MKLSKCLLPLWMLLPLAACAQSGDYAQHYLGQTPPSIVPEVFAPGIISREDEYEFGSVFNREATAFFYGVDIGGRSEIRYSAFTGNGWSNPEVILSNPDYGLNDPFLSPDEKRLYFISQRAMDGKGAKQDYDIWYVEKKGKGWSAPVNAGPNINTKSDEYYISFTTNGTMYFSSNKVTADKSRNDFDIYYAEFVDDSFQEAVRLGDAINTPSYEADVFIDPDEQYIIFCANRPDGLGRGDLYISFKQADGSWTTSINMGDRINTKGHELCPFVSADGKYFFYTSNQDIYWVSTELFTEIKKTVKD